MMNRKTIIELIRTEYGVAPEKLWLQYLDYLVFRNPRNQKWFAILMDVDRSRLGLEGEGKTDVLNLTCDPILIGSLLMERGFLPAYHMNKRRWIGVLLDGSVPDGELTELIRFSYALIEKKK